MYIPKLHFLLTAQVYQEMSCLSLPTLYFNQLTNKYNTLPFWTPREQKEYLYIPIIVFFFKKKKNIYIYITLELDNNSIKLELELLISALNPLTLCLWKLKFIYSFHSKLTHNVDMISTVSSKILKCRYYHMHITWLNLI